MNIPHYFEDPQTLHVNTMENRSYYIPFSDEAAALHKQREESDRLLLLNGDWKFGFYKNFPAVPEGFFAPAFDESAFGTLPVPSVWQMHGYDHHQYVNTQYPFP